MSKHTKKIRFIIHYVKPTAQLLFKIIWLGKLFDWNCIQNTIFFIKNNAIKISCAKSQPYCPDLIVLNGIHYKYLQSELLIPDRVECVWFHGSCANIASRYDITGGFITRPPLETLGELFKCTSSVSTPWPVSFILRARAVVITLLLIEHLPAWYDAQHTVGVTETCNTRSTYLVKILFILCCYCFSKHLHPKHSTKWR